MFPLEGVSQSRKQVQGIFINEVSFLENINPEFSAPEDCGGLIMEGNESNLGKSK